MTNNRKLFFERKYKRWDDLPKICKTCSYTDYDFRDEDSPSIFHCEKGLVFPVKKNSCKKYKDGRSVGNPGIAEEPKEIENGNMV